MNQIIDKMIESVMLPAKKEVIDIVMLSYGKDSTVMLDMMLRKGMKVDHVIFCDTGCEFDALQEYKIRYDELLINRYGIEVITLYPETTIEEWIFGKMETGERKGSIRGIPMQTIPCYWKREAKVKPAEKWVKEHYPKTKVNIYIGYAKGEDRQIIDTKYITHVYPLKDFNMTENDCLVYLREHEMENELYREFTRLGCSICPYQSDRSWKAIHDSHPKIWDWVKNIENELLLLESSGESVANRYFFMNYLTTKDMEHKFKMTADGLFDLSYEPVKNCFCYI